MDGTSIWAGDGIHLTWNATRVAAMKLMAYISGGGESGEPANKRARLGSVIPVKSTPQPAAKAAQPAPPPLSPLWLPGQLPANQRRNSHPREVSSAEAGAVKAREEARPVTWDRPPPPPRGGTIGRPRGGRPGRWGRW